MTPLRHLACFVLLAFAAAPALAADDSAEAVADKFWSAGDLAGGEKALAARVAAQAGDDQARFALGTTQFFRGVEKLMQSLHTYGLKSQGEDMGVPFLRLPTPPNPNPKSLTYADARRILQEWITDVTRAEQTLAGVKSEEVKLPLRIGMVRLDFDGDGKASDAETLWRIFAAVQPGARVTAANAAEFSVALDAGDVAWLRGYCHLLAGLAEVALAHDGQELFNATAHIFFQKVESPFPFLQEGKKIFDFGTGVDVVDAIALVHLLRLPVKEPERMKVALGHFQQVVAMSRLSWKLILDEGDNDREWIPNAAQHTVLGNVRVTADVIQTWLKFLDEMDDLLAGKRLAPFWRSNDGRGVNVRKVFTEPTQFDLVLWIQGTAATPYLEKGELTRTEVWENIQRAFGGSFFGFAIWFN